MADLDRERADITDEAEQEQPGEIELAFGRIRSRLNEQLADCDEKLEHISSRLPPEEPKPPEEPEPLSPINPAAQTPLNQYVGGLAESPLPEKLPAPLSDKARETLRIAGNSSWQILLGFGVSFAVRVGILGIWLGGWLDKRFFGGTGIAAMLILLAVIVYSFVMLYKDVMREDKKQKALLEKLMQEEAHKKNGQK